MIRWHMFVLKYVKSKIKALKRWDPEVFKEHLKAAGRLSSLDPAEGAKYPFIFLLPRVDCSWETWKANFACACLGCFTIMLPNRLGEMCTHARAHTHGTSGSYGPAVSARALFSAQVPEMTVRKKNVKIWSADQNIIKSPVITGQRRFPVAPRAPPALTRQTPARGHAHLKFSQLILFINN